jgi:hypothetical protein
MAKVIEWFRKEKGQGNEFVAKQLEKLENS